MDDPDVALEKQGMDGEEMPAAQEQPDGLSAVLEVANDPELVDADRGDTPTNKVDVENYVNMNVCKDVGNKIEHERGCNDHRQLFNPEPGQQLNIQLHHPFLNKQDLTLDTEHQLHLGVKPVGDMRKSDTGCNGYRTYLAGLGTNSTSSFQAILIPKTVHVHHVGEVLHLGQPLLPKADHVPGSIYGQFQWVTSCNGVHNHHQRANVCCTQVKTVTFHDKPDTACQLVRSTCTSLMVSSCLKNYSSTDLLNMSSSNHNMRHRLAADEVLLIVRVHELLGKGHSPDITAAVDLPFDNSQILNQPSTAEMIGQQDDPDQAIDSKIKVHVIDPRKDDDCLPHLL